MPMLGFTLLKGTLSRQCERFNRHFTHAPKTVRVDSSCVQPLSMQIKPNVNVYAKTDSALQKAKALLSKVSANSAP